MSLWKNTQLEWHAIIALGQHTRSDDVGCGMPPRSLTTHTVGILGAWHAIISVEQQTRTNGVEHGMP